MENRRNIFDITFETDGGSSDSDISVDSFSSSASESESDSSGDESDNGQSEDRCEWRVNDRSDVQKRAFTGPNPGATVDLEPDATEFDFFALFFPVFLVEHLVRHTNLYARQKQQTKPDPNWRPVVEEEMKAWLGIRVFMSILHLPATALYWSTDALFGNLSIRRVMKRDRFDKISQYFHANDRTTHLPRDDPRHDKLHLIRPILDDVQTCCLQNYNPHQNTSVDEAMVKFRGRLAFRQYLPAKPTKYGIKVWMRADPVNGYTNEFQVYTGREGVREVGLGKRVVLDMTRKIWDRQHIVNMDNYFTSPQLFEDLLTKGTYARGTVRNNRQGFPSHKLKPKDVKEQGQFMTAQKGELTACLWKDKKHIFTLSTAENPAQIVSAVTRKSRTGEVRPVAAPATIPAYNDNMNGVDHADQIRTEYSSYRSSRRWWLYLFWFLFDLAVANGLILMKESTNHQRRTKTGRTKVRTMIEFRMNLAKQLIGDYTDNERAVLATVNVGHFPVKGVKRGRCKQCSKNRVRREIRDMCGQCNVHLCVECFQAYHRDLVRQ